MKDPLVDPRQHTFSQAQGLEELPSPLVLEEFSQKARSRVWDVFYSITCTWDNAFGQVDDEGSNVLLDLHVRFFGRPMDEFEPEIEDIQEQYKKFFLQGPPYNRVFDLLQHAMRHPQCPRDFIEGIKAVFEECRLAYVVDTNGPPTIFPAVTPQEGDAVIASRRDLQRAGQGAATGHLQEAAKHLAGGKWRDSVRESIAAVESVAKNLGTGGKTLGEVLTKLDRKWRIHPALGEALKKLYGWTSDEQGVRHAATDQGEYVDREEAVFMIGACASFCTYLLGKQRKGTEKGGRR